jgi:hypothetical protein
MMSTTTKAVVLAQSVTRSREKDNTADEPISPVAVGVSHSFDSNEATQRLAALTGAMPAPQTTTQMLGAVPHAARGGWRRRDWLLVGGAALAGLVVASSIFRKR